jgi:hypothetical protein
MIIKFPSCIPNKLNSFLSNHKHSYKLEIKFITLSKLILTPIISKKKLINQSSINNFLTPKKP